VGVARLILGAAIAWQAVVLSTSDAAKHAGETATVEGTVANVKHAPRFHAIFVDFDQAYPNQSFTAYIDEKNAANFPDVDKLMSHKARVTGKIEIYKGKPQIVVVEASQLVGE
jgi:hypothetical protein